MGQEVTQEEYDEMMNNNAAAAMDGLSEDSDASAFDPVVIDPEFAESIGLSGEEEAEETAASEEQTEVETEADVEVEADAESEEEAEVEEDSVSLISDYQSNYTNTFAKFFGGMADSFGDNIVGNLCSKLAEFVENHFGDDGTTEDVTWSEVSTEDVMARSDGGAASEVKDAAVAATGVDTESFINDLNSAADSISNGSEAEEDSLTGKLVSTVSDSASASPADTGEAIKMFTESAQAHIDTLEGNEAVQAQSSLDTIVQTMGTAYYSTLLQNESEGTKMLSEETVQAADLTGYGGISMSYAEYTPDADISVAVSPDSDAADVHADIVAQGYEKQSEVQDAEEVSNLKSSDGSMYADLEGEYADSVYDASAQGSEDAAFGTFYEIGRTGKVSDEESINASLKVTEIRKNMSYAYADGAESGDEAVSSGYMQLMLGYQAYNDSAVEKINEMYADDPEKKAQATEGLGATMRASISMVWDAMKEDDEALGFLTDEDKETLNSMSITGINVSYDDYQSGMDLKTGEMEEEAEETVVEDFSAEEAALYGNADVPTYGSDWAPASQKQSSAFVDDVSYESSDEDTIERSGGSHTDTHADRVAAAEKLSSGILGSDKQEENVFGL